MNSETSSGLAIAMVSTPWIATPPLGYGGIERVVSVLTERLSALGHRVTLFAAHGSASYNPTTRVVPVLPRLRPDQSGGPIHEVDHVSRVFDFLLSGEYGEFDVLHSHGPASVAFANLIRVPVVHTIHNPLDDKLAFYRRHGGKVSLVGISHSQLEAAPRLRATIIPNPVEVASVRPVERTESLLWIGRFEEFKGAHRAIRVARDAGLPLRLAAPLRQHEQPYFDAQIKPFLGPDIEYVGEVGGVERERLFASAKALLSPNTGNEAFGLVTVEAMAVGTPVIAFARGAAREVVIDGRTGFLVDDEEAMVRAISRTDEIDPRVSRQTVIDRYDPARVAEMYIAVYRAAIARPHTLAATRPA